MRFGAVSLGEAVGAILAHSLVDTNGHKVFSKGRVIRAEDLNVMRDCGLTEVVVARLEAGDLDENAAAKRVGEALAGEHLKVTAPGVGRANLIATAHGVLRVNVPALERINNLDPGIAISTLHQHTLVHAGELVTLVKIIPFGMSEARVIDAERIAREAAPVIGVRPLIPRSVGLIISGGESSREKLIKSFETPIRKRVEKIYSILDNVSYTAHDAPALAAAIRKQIEDGREVVLLASVSAIIDAHDVAPTALALAGGSMTHFGVPVDPGNLLMLGYVGDVPVVGMPGCVKSPKTNVIDLLLPRLCAGERLTRADLVALGHGGLMEDVDDDRPMPREE